MILMLRSVLKEVKEYKAASVATPIFMIGEVLMETLIPFLMASIIDDGVNAGRHRSYLQSRRSDDPCRGDRTCSRNGGRKIRCESIRRTCKKSEGVDV